MLNDSTSPSAERARQEKVARQQRIARRDARRVSQGWPIFTFFVLVVSLVLGSLLMLYVVRRAGSGTLLGSLASRLLSGQEQFTSAPDVVSQIQRLNRLETVSYSVDTVVEGKHTNAVLPDLLFGDRLLLVVHGQVIAGVDLSKLRPESVQINGRSVTLDLPASQVFTARIDSGKTRVFARTTGLLTPADPNLESDTRKIAETQILQAATADGILHTARGNARNSMESLLRGLGFTQVTVR